MGRSMSTGRLAYELVGKLPQFIVSVKKEEERGDGYEEM